MNKRVHEIAKERGLTSKDVLERLRAAGIEVKAASSNVDEDVARRVLADGAAAPTAPTAEPAPAPEAPPGPAEQPDDPRGVGSNEAGSLARPMRGRPTRDSLQGERAPGSAGGRRRVVIDSQASRRAPGGGGPPQSSQPPRRQRRGRRRRGTYDEVAESRPSTQTVVAEPAIRINSGSTVKDVAEYLDVSQAEIIKKLMELGEMKTLTQTLPDDAIGVRAAEYGKEAEVVHSEEAEIE